MISSGHIFALVAGSLVLYQCRVCGQRAFGFDDPRSLPKCNRRKAVLR